MLFEKEFAVSKLFFVIIPAQLAYKKIKWYL